MPRETGNDRSGVPLTRREAIKTVGVASTSTILAGCSSEDQSGTPAEATNGTESTTGESNEPSGDRAEQPFRWSWARGDMTEMELNYVNPAHQAELQYQVYAMIGQPIIGTNEWLTLDTKGRDEGWAFDEANNEFHIEFKEDLHWHQGGEVIDDYTGEDFMMQEELQHLLTQANPEESAEGSVIQGYDHDGKTTIFQLSSEGVNKDLFPRQFIRRELPVYREQWRDIYESLKDATTESERGDVRQQAVERQIRLGDDPPLSGPYMLQSINTQVAEFTRNPEHWSAEHNNWDNYQIINNSGGGGNAAYQAALQDNIDMNVTYPDTVNNREDHIVEVLSATGSPDGYALAINYGGDADPWFGFEGGPSEDDTAGKRQALARQALGYQMNFRDISVNQWGEAGSRMALLEKAVPGEPQKVEEQFPDIYESAPSFAEQQPAKAEEALEKSGLSKENGTWVKPNGDPLRIEIESFEFSRDAISTMAEDFRELGIETEHVTQESSVLFSRKTEGSYALAHTWFFGIDGPISQMASYPAPEAGVYPPAHQPRYYEIPPIGELNAEPNERVDAQQLANTISTTPPEEHQEELRKLVWLNVYHQPKVYTARMPNTSGFNRTRFEYPQYPEPDEQQVSVATPDNGAPVWLAHQAWRLVRRGLEEPNNLTVREEYM